MREWLIKKLIGNKPVIANVTLTIKGSIKASEPEIVFHNSYISESERGTF